MKNLALDYADDFANSALDDVEFHLPLEQDVKSETYYIKNGKVHAVVLDLDNPEYATFNNGEKPIFSPF